MDIPHLISIENADHMVSRRADEYDFDGWYRSRIHELVAYARKLEAERETARLALIDAVGVLSKIYKDLQ